MLAMLDGVLMPPDGKGFRRFAMCAYTEEESIPELVGGVRDYNHARDIVNSFTKKGGCNSRFIPGRAPKGAKVVWNIWTRVSETRRGISHYQIDYHRFPGCPVAASEEMMEIFALLRSNIKGGQRSLKERKAKLRAERTRKREESLA